MSLFSGTFWGLLVGAALGYYAWWRYLGFVVMTYEKWGFFALVGVNVLLTAAVVYMAFMGGGAKDDGYPAKFGGWSGGI